MIFSGFDAVKLSNNIAILQVDGEFDVGKAVIPICLPSESGLSELDLNNCVATGWGRPATGLLTQYMKQPLIHPLWYSCNLKINTSFNPLYFTFLKLVQIILERIYLKSKIYAT